MQIRPASPADAPALADLGERLWRETYTGLIPSSNLELHLAETFGLVQQTGELMDPANWTLVVDVDGVPHGYSLLRAHGPKMATAQVPFERPLEVVRFYVDRSLHGRGAAQVLMAEVLARAEAAGHDGVWLQVWEQNPRAIRFYAKAGFLDAGDATYRIGEQVDRDRLLVHSFMARPLRP